MSRSEGANYSSPGNAVPLIQRVSRLGLYLAALAVASSLLLIALVYLQFFSHSLSLPRLSAIGFVFFLALAAFAEKYTVEVGPSADVSATFLAYFLSAALLGPLASFLVAVVGQVLFFRRGQWSRNLCFAASLGLASGISALVYWGVPAAFAHTATYFAVSGVAAGLVYQLINFLVFVPVAKLRRNLGPAGVWKEGFQPFLPFHFFFLFVSLGLIYIYNLSHNALAFMLFFLPVLGLIYAFRNYSKERELARRLERFSLQMAASMITALDLKDNYTAQHSAAVAQYSLDIARTLNLSDRECNLAHLAGLLHDLGKISVPDDILNATGKLDASEWALVETHCQAGQKILSNMTEFAELSQIVLHHHERYDGKGYPLGVAGEAIPLLSRIVCVADSYSAMVSDRPYRARLSTDFAKSEVAKMRGTQFDPAIATAFVKVLEAHDEQYRRAEHLDFHVQFQKVKFLRDLAA